MHKLKVHSDTASLIRKMHPHIKKKVRSSLGIIISKPHSGKALKDELNGLWSFRVGRLRIIYRITAGVIEIIALGPRKAIYEETLRLIRKKKDDV